MAGSVINWPPGYRSVFPGYGSADPDALEIFTDEEHWLVPSMNGEASNLHSLLTDMLMLQQKISGLLPRRN